MTKEEVLLRELCLEVAVEGVHTDRFTELWMETGLVLDEPEFDIAQKILSKSDVVLATTPRSRATVQ